MPLRRKITPFCTQIPIFNALMFYIDTSTGRAFLKGLSITQWKVFYPNLLGCFVLSHVFPYQTWFIIFHASLTIIAISNFSSKDFCGESASKSWYNSLWASSFNWNARDGTDSQVWGAFGGQIDFFVFSVTFGINSLWDWFLVLELSE